MIDGGRAGHDWNRARVVAGRRGATGQSGTGRRLGAVEHLGRSAADVFAGARGARLGRLRGLIAAERCRRGELSIVDHGAGEAEVDHADPAVVADEHVVGLEVAVGDAGGVGGLEAAAGGEELAQDLAPAHRPRQLRRVAEPAGQGLAANQLHRDEQPAVVGAGLVDLDDVGMRDLRQGLGLAQQALVALDLGAAAHELERDLAVELVVVGGVDLAHRAGAEWLEQDEPTDADGLELAEQRRAHLLLAEVRAGGRVEPRREAVGGGRVGPAKARRCAVAVRSGLVVVAHRGSGLARSASFWPCSWSSKKTDRCDRRISAAVDRRGARGQVCVLSRRRSHGAPRAARPRRSP